MSLVNSSRWQADNVVESPLTPSDALFGFAMATKRMLGERHPSTLVVSTHPKMHAIGDRVLLDSEFPPHRKEKIVGDSHQVIEGLRRLVQRRYRDFAVVMSAFETHHIPPEQLPEIVELMQLLSHGSTIITDFALADAPEKAVIDLAARKVDRDQLRRSGGPKSWADSHRIFTERSFFDETQQADWTSQSRFRVEDFGVGLVGSHDFPPDEMEIIAEQALMMRAQLLQAFMQPTKTAY